MVAKQILKFGKLFLVLFKLIQAFVSYESIKTPWVLYG